VAATYLNTAVTALSSLIVIPIYLHLLGRERFGVWVAVTGFVGYLGMVNLGLEQAVANRFAEAMGRRDVRRASRVLASGFWSYVKVVVVCLVVCVFVIPAVPWHVVIKTGGAVRGQIPFLVAISAGTFLVDLPLGVFSTSLVTSGWIHLQQLAAIAQTVLRALVGSLYLLAGGGLTGFFLILGLITLASDSVLWLVLRRKTSASARPLHRDRAEARSLRSPSFYFLVLQVSSTILFGSDVLIIAWAFGARSVAPYAIAVGLITLSSGTVASLTTNFGPRFLGSYSKRQAEGLFGDFSRSLLLSLCLGSLVLVGLFLEGRSFILLWVGSSAYVGNATFYLLAAIGGAQILLFPSDTLLIFTTQHRAYAISAVWEAVVRVGLALVLLRPWGIAGIAVAGLIGRFVGCGPTVLARTGSLLGSRVWKAAAHHLGLVALPVLITVAVGVSLPRQQSNWAGFIVVVVALTLAFGLSLSGAYLLHRRRSVGSCEFCRLTAVGAPDGADLAPPPLHPAGESR
jgi:O-antigen/teichoic acid export membrane protein